MADIKEISRITAYILLIIFAVFIIYQIIIKILGGSWELQDIVIALLVLIIGFLFNLTIKLTKLESDFNNIKSSFCNMAKDFKEHLNNHFA